MTLKPLLDKPGVPKYLLADRAIRRAVAGGDYGPGDRLPGQMVLARQLGIAPMTVRRAIGRLIEEGILERRPRSGTYVRREVRAPNLCLLGFHVSDADVYHFSLTRGALDAMRVAASAVSPPDRQVRAMILPEPLPPVEQVVRELRTMEVGAVGLIGFRNREADFIRELTQCVPGVFFHKGLPGVPLPTAKPDTDAGAAIIADWLVGRGRQRVAFARVDLESENDTDLSYALQSALRARGLPVDLRRWLVPSAPARTAEEDERLVADWLSERMDDPDPPDAVVFTVNYAHHLERLLAARGLRAGRDVDVVLRASQVNPAHAREHVHPILHLRAQEVAEDAADMLLSIVREGDDGTAEVRFTRPELIVPEGLVNPGEDG